MCIWVLRSVPAPAASPFSTQNANPGYPGLRMNGRCIVGGGCHTHIGRSDGGHMDHARRIITKNRMRASIFVIWLWFQNGQSRPPAEYEKAKCGVVLRRTEYYNASIKGLQKLNTCMLLPLRYCASPYMPKSLFSCSAPEAAATYLRVNTRKPCSWPSSRQDMQYTVQ